MSDLENNIREQLHVLRDPHTAPQFMGGLREEVIHILGTPKNPVAPFGTYTSKQKFFQDFLGPTSSKLQGGLALKLSAEPIVSGNRAVVQLEAVSHEGGQAMTLDGKPYNNSLCWVITFSPEGQVTHIFDYFDTHVRCVAITSAREGELEACTHGRTHMSLSQFSSARRQTVSLTSLSPTSTLPSAMAPSRAVTKPRAAPQGGNTLQTLWRAYLDETPARLQLCDAFLIFHMLAGVLLFGYVFVVAYPFNAFLAAFASNVGQFVLIASLRMQVNAANKAEFGSTSPERAFAEFCFASIVLHAFSINYLG